MSDAIDTSALGHVMNDVLEDHDITSDISEAYAHRTGYATGKDFREQYEELNAATLRLLIRKFAVEFAQLRGRAELNALIGEMLTGEFQRGLRP